MHDTSYRPEHSWVVEQQGRLLSHIRIYDRWIRVGQAKLHIAGIGNVITARDARGHGYVGRIMATILPVLQQEGYALSLLWTHLTGLYGRSGWVPIEQEVVRAVLHPTLSGSVRIGPAQQQELPALMHLYDVANAQRTGTTGRSPEYWQELPLWLQEKANDSSLLTRTRWIRLLAMYAVESRRMRWTYSNWRAKETAPILPTRC